MADVFISYKRERRPAARHLEQILVRYGYSVWFDHALVRGADYEEQIQRELTAAKAVIVLWCGLSVQSAGVRSEASRAKAQGKLLPVVIEPCELPLFSTLEQNIDLKSATGSPRDHALDPILDDLERLVGRAPVAKLPLEQVATFEADYVMATSPPVVGPSHDHAFWKAEWEALRSDSDPGSHLDALKVIAENAPPYIADLARARIAKETKAADQLAAIKYGDEGRIKVDAAIFSPCDSEAAQVGWLKPGAGKAEWFKDLDCGPEMVVVPGAGGIQNFAIGRFALTFAEWDAAQGDPDWQRYSGIAPRMPDEQGWRRGKQPVIDVNWDDAKAYCRWLSAIAAKTYRLPSEPEWEHACRAGSKTEFWWGNRISTDQANYNGEYAHGNFTFLKFKKDEYRRRTVPVDSFEANPWGLYQVHGNVWEWCEDPVEWSARIMRGGSWNSLPFELCSAHRGNGQPGNRHNTFGFRVARTL